MHLWAGLFRELPFEPVDLRLPDGASWLWVDQESGKLSGDDCEGAVQIPFVEGSEPLEMSSCMAYLKKEDKESFWRKWFGKKE